jgi:hypothetical protein
LGDDHYCDVWARDGRGLDIAYAEKDDTFNAGVAEVSVDRSTGKIKVHNIWKQCPLRVAFADVAAPLGPDGSHPSLFRSSICKKA